MEHANRKELDISDVKLAIAEKSAEIQKTKLTHKELIELAREHNKSKLPPISTEEYGLHLPPDVLTNCNYKMLSQTPKVHKTSVFDTIGIILPVPYFSTPSIIQWAIYCVMVVLWVKTSQERPLACLQLSEQTPEAQVLI